MDEILQKLMESELLSEETKSEIRTQFESAVNTMREELALEVRAEMVEQYSKDREALLDTVEEKVSEMLAAEMSELNEDISSFRDLEVEYAKRLTEAKKSLAVKLGEELDEIVDKVDAFLEYRIEEEMTELKEDLEVVKQNQFGRKIFESFMAEYNRSFIDEESLQKQLAVLEDKLADAEQRLSEAEEAEKKAARAKKLDEVLAPLSGAKREQMTLILQNVETGKLQEAYNRFVGRILKEETATESKASLTESKSSKTTEVKTGDVVIEEEVKKDEPAKSQDQSTIRMLSLAGVRAQ